MRQARACSAWARPISPPSAVTAALLDMFCGLNGRTLIPRLLSARHRPATINDFPTSEPVPWNISAPGVSALGVNALGGNALGINAPGDLKAAAGADGSGIRIRFRAVPSPRWRNDA